MHSALHCPSARSLGVASTSGAHSQHQRCLRHLELSIGSEQCTLSHFSRVGARGVSIITASASGRGGQGPSMPNGSSPWANLPARGRDFGASARESQPDPKDGQLLQSDLFGKTATVRFHLKYKTSFGQGVKLLGSHPKLGAWNIKNAVELRWTAGDQWVASVPLPAGGVYEYKYVLIDYETKQALEWQSGSNAVLAVVVSETDLDVYDNWGNNPGAMVQVDEESMTRETKLQRWANEMMGYWKEARRLQIELVQKNNETQGLRNELAQLRMELSMEKQSRLETEAKLTNLQVENAGLKAQLVQKTVELNNTLAEVLQLLDKELEDEEQAAEAEYYDEYEQGDDDDLSGSPQGSQRGNESGAEDGDSSEGEDDTEPPAEPLHQRYVNGFVDILRNGPSLAARAPSRNAAR